MSPGAWPEPLGTRRCHPEMSKSMVGAAPGDIKSALDPSRLRRRLSLEADGGVGSRAFGAHAASSVEMWCLQTDGTAQRRLDRQGQGLTSVPLHGEGGWGPREATLRVPRRPDLPSSASRPAVGSQPPCLAPCPFGGSPIIPPLLPIVFIVKTTGVMC